MLKVKIGSDDKKLHFVGFAVLAWVVMFTGISFNCECLHVYCMNLYIYTVYTWLCVLALEGLLHRIGLLQCTAWKSDLLLSSKVLLFSRVIYKRFERSLKSTSSKYFYKAEIGNASEPAHTVDKKWVSLVYQDELILPWGGWCVILNNLAMSVWVPISAISVSCWHKFRIQRLLAARSESVASQIWSCVGTVAQCVRPQSCDIWALLVYYSINPCTF